MKILFDTLTRNREKKETYSYKAKSFYLQNVEYEHVVAD